MNEPEVITTEETGSGRRYRGRPLGILVIAVIQVVHAFAVASSIELPAILPLDPIQPVDALDPVSPLAPFVIVAGLAIALGLWQLRYWAWFLTMLWVGASMAGALVAYFEGEPAYVVMVISVFAVFYLHQWEVRSAFRAHPREGRAT